MEINENDAIKITEYMEIIRTSLAKIGSMYFDDPESLAKAICYFCLDYDVFKKVSTAYRIMVDAIENNEKAMIILDHTFENMAYWNIPQSISMDDIVKKMERP